MYHHALHAKQETQISAVVQQSSRLTTLERFQPRLVERNVKLGLPNHLTDILSLGWIVSAKPKMDDWRPALEQFEHRVYNM